MNSIRGEVIAISVIACNGHRFGFDIGSNVLLIWLHCKMSWLDSNKWPVGGSRSETIGNVVYGVYMSTIPQHASSALIHLAGFLCVV